MTTATDPSILQVGEAVQYRGAAVAPLFPRLTPRAEYISLDEAVGLGLRVEEVGREGSVSQLKVVNATGVHALLYEGEELAGAKQDRILDVAVLVEAGATVLIPVSCVEHGRWGGPTRSFEPSPRTGHPELRRRKAERLASAPDGMHGAAQSEVWAAVEEKAERLDVRSSTGAQAASFTTHRSRLEALMARFPLQPGQCGAVLALSGRPVCIDVVSRPDVFAHVYPKVLAGYMLDALEHPDAAETSDAELDAFVADAVAAPARCGRAVGLGDALRISGRGIVGSGLELDGELIQLSAHAR